MSEGQAPGELCGCRLNRSVPLILYGGEQGTAPESGRGVAGRPPRRQLAFRFPQGLVVRYAVEAHVTVSRISTPARCGRASPLVIPF